MGSQSKCFSLKRLKKRPIKGKQTNSKNEKTHSKGHKTTIQGWKNAYKESVNAGQG